MLGGVRQWVLVRGRRAESPILLKLHGGPGQAEMATARLNGLLEDDFVIGSPPYAGPEGIAKWGRCARWLGEFGALWHSSEKFDRVGWMLGSIEYSWPEKLRFNRAAGRSFALLYADLLSVNLSETVPRVEVPVFFAEGRHDRMAPAEVAERYFTSLIAPRKELVWFENSAHFPQWEERARFHEFLRKTVLPGTAV